MSRGHARPSTPRTKAARVPVTSPCAASVLTPSCPCPTFWRNGPAWRWRRRSVRSRPTTSRQQVVDLGARACGAQVGQIQDCVSQEYNSGHRHWKPAHPPGGGGVRWIREGLDQPASGHQTKDGGRGRTDGHTEPPAGIRSTDACSGGQSRDIFKTKSGP
jgi:hypothetical protein